MTRLSRRQLLGGMTAGLLGWFGVRPSGSCDEAVQPGPAPTASHTLGLVTIYSYDAKPVGALGDVNTFRYDNVFPSRSAENSHCWSSVYFREQRPQADTGS